MKKNALLTLLIGSLFITLPCLSINGFSQTSPMPQASEFPGDNSAPNWMKKGDVREFPANALYGHIDGGAELFLEYGFKILRLQQYTKGTDEISIEIYHMENADAALGIYLMKCGNETPIPEIHSRNTGDSYQITILKGAYFITINNFGGQPSHKPAMIQLANQTLSNLPDEKDSNYFSLLPTENRIKGSELLIRGFYALQSVYTLGEGDILQLNNKIFAVTAQYNEKTTSPNPQEKQENNNSSYNLILVNYPDETSAQNAFNHLQANLDSYINVFEKSNNSIKFKDFKGKTGKINLEKNKLFIYFNLH